MVPVQTCSLQIDETTNPLTILSWSTYLLGAVQLARLRDAEGGMSSYT